MNKLTCLLSIGVCLVLSPSLVLGQTKYYYNTDSTRIGTSQPNTTSVGPGVVKERFRNKDGDRIGHSTQTGNTTYYYNHNSDRIGTSVSPKSTPKAGKK